MLYDYESLINQPVIASLISLVFWSASSQINISCTMTLLELSNTWADEGEPTELKQNYENLTL